MTTALLIIIALELLLALRYMRTLASNQVENAKIVAGQSQLLARLLAKENK